MSGVTVWQLDGFDDPRLGPDEWSGLLARGDTDTVFLTWHWQRAWWECFGRGRLQLLAAERDGQVVAIAPLFSEAGMVFFVGSGGSDYLDFVGDIGDPGMLEGILTVARRQVTGFVGLRFYHVPDRSRTGERLASAAERLGLICHDEGDLVAPALSLVDDPEVAEAATRKKSLVRHERFFLRNGELRTCHLCNGDQIRPHLQEFFQQHISRWQETPYPSLFLDADQRRFYERLTEIAAATGWLRFTRLDWDGQPIAFHFGSCYRGSYLWYKPSFDIALARRSPGEVLLRHLLLAALDEGAHTFDFGLGDEPFKRRFATHAERVRTWGLYPPELCEDKPGGTVAT